MLNRLIALLALAFVASPAAAFDIKNSATPGNNPALTTPGEIAINRADKRLIFKNVDGSLGYGSLLNALASGRKAVEQGDASDLKIGSSGQALSNLFSCTGLSCLLNSVSGANIAGSSGTTLFVRPAINLPTGTSLYSASSDFAAAKGLEIIGDVVRLTATANAQINTDVLSIGSTSATSPYLVFGSSAAASDPHIGLRSSGHAGPDVVLGATAGTGNTDGTLLVQAKQTNLIGGKLVIIPPAGTKGMLIQPPGEITTPLPGFFAFNEVFQSINAEVTGSLDPANSQGCACITSFQSTLFVGPNYKGAGATGGVFSVVTYGGSTLSSNISDLIGVGSGVKQEYDGRSRMYGGHAGVTLGANGKTPGLYGHEIELIINNPVGVPYRAGYFALNTGPQRATAMDAAFMIGCSVPGGCWKHAIGLVTQDATWPNVDPLQSPLDPTGDIIGSERAFTIAHILNLPTANVTGNILNFASATLSGAGIMVNAGTRYYGPAPTAPPGQVAYGGQLTTDTTKCGSLAGSAGCVLVNVAGTTRYYPYY